MKPCRLFLILFSASLVSFSQETSVGYTLNEAIAFALENNYSALNAERDIIDAQKQKWETIASGLPQITADISYQNQLKQPISLIPAEFFGGQPGEVRTSYLFSTTDGNCNCHRTAADL